MATSITNDLRIQNSKNLADTLINNNRVFISKPTQWDTGDNSPPTPLGNREEFYDVYNQMISLTSIGSSNVDKMILKTPWTSGVTYDIYRHDYSPTNTSFSGASNLYDARFVVINTSNSVYVCLNNNNNTISTVEPQNLSDDPFTTSDGYQWLRVYNIQQSDFVSNSTTTLIPIKENDVISSTSGAIYTSIIITPGDGYTASPAGVVNQLPYYLTPVLGDGSGAIARVVIGNDGSISDIEMESYGSGYTYGFIDFADGNAYETIEDLNNETNSLNPQGNSNFTSTVIIGPPGGWGTDLAKELGATRVGVFITIPGNEIDFPTDVTYRQIGILKDVITSDAGASTLDATFAIKVTQVSGPAEYIIGEEVSQEVLGSPGEYAKGTLIIWDSSNGIISYIQDPKIHSSSDGNLYSFDNNNNIEGSISSKITQPEAAFNGELDDRSFISGTSQPELSKYTGDLLYLSNIQPVLRDNSQNEKVSIIISY